MTEPELARVVEIARRAAAAANHAFVGTEHLLAASLTDGEGAAARALTAAGVSLDGLAEELLSGLPVAQGTPSGAPPLSRFAERAVQEAGREGGDLLAVLLRSPKGRIASVLAQRGARARDLVRAVEPSAPPPAAPPSKPAEAPRPGKQRAAEPVRQRPDEPPGPQRQAQRARQEPEEPRRKGKERRPSAPSGGPTTAPEEPAAERRLPPHLEPRARRPGAYRRFPWRLALLAAVPASLILESQHASPLLVFSAACLGVIPLAGFMGEATEHLADRAGPAIGGLLNATFGNAAELIIAVVALRAGLVDLVKASITGSILGNLLLILGLSLVAGGVRAPLLRFNRTSAGMSSAMLALAVAGLVFPALFHAIHATGGDRPAAFGYRLSADLELSLSEVVAAILALTYLCSLVFSLRTHRSLIGPEAEHGAQAAAWGVGRSVLVLAIATAAVAVESELLVGAVQGVTGAIGLSQTFLGLMVIPLIGNAAEHATAVTVARKGKTDLALQIALGSSTQIALLVAPLLVLAGILLGQPLSLVFTPLEVVALAVATGVVAIITLDGESHWFEGVQLLAVYGIIGAAAYFL